MAGRKQGQRNCLWGVCVCLLEAETDWSGKALWGCSDPPPQPLLRAQQSFQLQGLSTCQKTAGEGFWFPPPVVLWFGSGRWSCKDVLGGVGCFFNFSKQAWRESSVP